MKTPIDKMEPQITAEQRVYCHVLIKRGYRCVSNHYGVVTRIDRADWVQAMAHSMHRSVAEFYIAGTDIISPIWADHYRRVYSKDCITLSPSVLARLIPPSGWDDTGFIDAHIVRNVHDGSDGSDATDRAGPIPKLNYEQARWAVCIDGDRLSVLRFMDAQQAEINELREKVKGL